MLLDFLFPFRGCLVFDYGYKVTTNFYTCKFFLTFFILFFIGCNHTYIFRFFRVPPFSVVVCPDGNLPYIRAYIRAYTRTRTGIFRL